MVSKGRKLFGPRHDSKPTSIPDLRAALENARKRVHWIGGITLGHVTSEALKKALDEAEREYPETAHDLPPN